MLELVASLAGEGTAIEVGGNHPFLLDDPETAWVVGAGGVDVFSAWVGADGVLLDRQHEFHVPAGQVLLGAGRTEGAPSLALVGVAALDSAVHRVSTSRLLACASDARLAPQVRVALERWRSALSRRRAEELRIPDPAAEGPAGLLSFHHAALARLAERRRLEHEAESRRTLARADNDRRMLGASLRTLASILEADDGASPARPDPVPLRAALDLIGRSAGVELQLAPTGSAGPSSADPVVSMARDAGLDVRRVALRGSWWRSGHGPLLVFRDSTPLAILPSSGRGHLLVDPATGRRERVGAVENQRLASFGYACYPRLPARGASGWDLVRLGLHGCRSDLVTVLMMGLLGGLLGLAVPLATGLLFDSVIPAAQRAQLRQVVVALLAAAIAATLFEVARGFALLRMEGRLGSTLQAAIWSRLLDLPAAFFRRFTAGDLVMRAFGVDVIRRALSASTVSLLTSAAFGFLNVALLFYYDRRIALWALALIALAAAVAVGSGVRLVKLQRRMTDAQGRIEGFVLQIVGAVAKLRTAQAETRAFARWAGDFAEQRRSALLARAPLQVFESVYPVLATLVIYALVVGSGETRLSTGGLIAFLAAFAACLAATLQGCRSILGALAIGPTLDRLRPILQTDSEASTAKSDPGLLTGEIEIAHLSFRYSAEGPLVLDDISLRFSPGEFIALVGPSGSGKSSLLRLLLAFERPTSGAIFYDGRDLSGLDPRALRRQIGTVLQDGKLITGDILTNIVGSSNLGRQEALEAACMAGLDRDLERMPMGINTLISEGGSTLSGGQRQRILIARALVRRPRVMFFDEATSALDNRTQTVVTASLKRLEATRLVIAHRLSTIIGADRIVVLAAGRVVQSGTYAELIAQPGPFAALARRQLT